MILILLFLVLNVFTKCPEENKDNVIVFWNLENFYDYTDGGTGESDTEFSSKGKRIWTSKRFYEKCRSIAKVIFWIGDRYARMPDVIGVAEVENRSVLSRMISSTGLRKHDYAIVHRDSGDRRGIDVALLYRTGVFEIVDISYVTPFHDEHKMSTRDILCVKLQRISDGKVFDFIVNHHPSKFGGSKSSADRRESVMQALCSVCDSLGRVSSTIYDYGGIIAMGDFNDTPDGSQFSLLAERLENSCAELFDNGEGTIRYEGKWDLIDMFWVSGSIKSSCTTESLRVPFLMTRERRHPGEKPLRTYSGPRYLGGVSDHCPIVLKIQ